MVKLIALYKKPADVFKFEMYYFEEHLPLAYKIPGLRKLEISRITGLPDGGESEYHMMAELYFDNMAALEAGMSSEAGKKTAADALTFAKDIVTMMLAKEEDTASLCTGLVN